MTETPPICAGCGKPILYNGHDTRKAWLARKYHSRECRMIRSRKAQLAEVKAQANEAEARPVVLPLVSILMDGEPKRYEMRRVEG